jgi:hypothetical protein
MMPQVDKVPPVDNVDLHTWILAVFPNAVILQSRSEGGKVHLVVDAKMPYDHPKVETVRKMTKAHPEVVIDVRFQSGDIGVPPIHE